jgi:molybdate transport system ATP-binding protein
MRRKLLPFLQRVRDEIDIPILFVSHDPTEMQALCSQVLVLKEGKVTAFGPAVDVLRDPVLLSTLPGSVENTLDCIIAESDGDLGVVLVGRSTKIYTRHRHERPGEAASLSIRARDILIARGCPESISARNRLAAEVVEVREGGGTSLVVLRLNGEEVDILVEATHRALQDLAIATGQHLTLVFKAASCTVMV